MDTPAPQPGLCAGCEHARVVTGARSLFWMCRRAETEPEAYPRYPRLPVLSCPGWEAGEPGRATGSADAG